MAEEREIQQPIKIEFDAAHNPETPTLVLAKRNGEKIGEIIAKDVVLTDFFNDASQIQFNVYKYIDGKLDGIWESIDNFKLIWCRNWDVWFEIAVEISETNDTQKMVTCTQLGQAELSQKIIDGIEINTETDIARADYDPEYPTVFWNPDRPASSLLHRMMDDVPHYTVEYVDPTLCNIQRTFTFDNVSLYDAFQEVAEEVGCVFVFPSDSVDGKPNRTIRVYDLEANCKDCDYRGEFTGECPECGSSNIDEGYGFDTTIFITADDLGEDLQFTTDTGSVKNVFKLVAGDDVMTATVQGCNPTGSNRIWYIPSYMREDMTKELQEKLAAYDSDYEYYRSDYDPIADGKVSSSSISEYNNLVAKYSDGSFYHGNTLQEINASALKGYTKLMEAMYATIDTAVYLQSVMMPNAEYGDSFDTDLDSQLEALKELNKETIAVVSMNRATSEATATSAVLSMAKVVVNPNFQVKAYSTNWTLKETKISDDESVWSGTWVGYFVVTDYSDSENSGTTDSMTLEVVDGSYDDNYRIYLANLIDKALGSDNTEDLSIVGLFNKTLTWKENDDGTYTFSGGFYDALHLYCLDELTIFNSACESVLSVLQEMGLPDGSSWGNVKDDIYDPYYYKWIAIQYEMDARQQEIYIVTGYLDNNQDQVYGTQTYLNDAITYIQDILNMANYMGDDLWKELCAYRREDIYTNSNYISDGLDNAQIFSNALQFIKVASDELYKSAERQHSISSTLHDLLTIKKFEPIVDYFAVGNWLRLRIDGSIYKLRLISYSIDYNDLKLITVDFSDVTQVATGLTDLQSVVQQAASMGTSYSYTQHQATNGDSAKSTIAGWSLNGLDVTNTKIVQSAEGQDQTWDEHGMLFRKYDPITDTYADEQLKIVNGTMAITTDNWKTISTAVGRFYYQDPHDSSHMIEAYGVNGQVLVGQLLLGEALGIYAENEKGETTFEINGDGIYVYSDNALVIKTENFTIDEDGNVCLKGEVYASSGSFTGEIQASAGKIGGWTIGTSSLYNGLSKVDGTDSGTYIGTDGIRQYSGGHYIDIISGTLSANNVNLSGSIATTGADSDGTSKESKLSSGSLSFKYGDEDLGAFETARWENTDYRGIAMHLPYQNNFMSFSRHASEDATTYTTAYFISYTDDISTYRHNFSGSVHMSSSLSVDGEDYTGITLANNKHIYSLASDGSSTVSIANLSSSDVIQIGASSQQYSLYLFGSTIYVNSEPLTSSDERLKKNIISLSSTFANSDNIANGIIFNLTPISFEYKKNDGKINFGFTVQDVENVIRSLDLDPKDYHLTAWSESEEDGEEYGSVSYTEFIPLLVQVSQDQHKEIESLKSENEELKSKFDELEKRLEKLESNFA